jgi:NADP-dependent 3-hydroxy acid dehydrogenase YdfG
MLVAITGHTSGIGLAIADWYTSRGHTVIGFSRSTGYDISDPDGRARVVQEAEGADLFVNNAYHEFAQVDLLYAMYGRWKNDLKTIVNISSRAGDTTRNFSHPYSIHKVALDKAIEQLQNTNCLCRILNLRPGYVDTPMVEMVSAKKLTAEYIAMIVGWMAEQPGIIKSLTVIA